MKTDHAHVEAALLAGLLVALVAVIDLFVDMADANDNKVSFYLIGFVALYLLARLGLKRLWRQ